MPSCTEGQQRAFRQRFHRECSSGPEGRPLAFCRPALMPWPLSLMTCTYPDSLSPPSTHPTGRPPASAATTDWAQPPSRLPPPPHARMQSLEELQTNLATYKTQAEQVRPAHATPRHLPTMALPSPSPLSQFLTDPRPGRPGPRQRPVPAARRGPPSGHQAHQ